MKSRGDDVEEFATFAHHVQMCRKNVDTYKQQIEYTKSLFEASMSICCQLTNNNNNNNNTAFI